MHKKLLFIGMLLIISSISFGCTNQEKINPNEAMTETTALESINIEDTEPATEFVDSTKSIYEHQSLISSGVLKSEPGTIDGSGNLRAHFSDSDGVDFIAIISIETELPEALIVGETYDVYHSDIELRSFPGQYPEVYKIQKKSN